MKDTFSVGEIAITQNATYFHEYDGYPCIIVESLDYRKGIDLNTVQWQQDYLYKVIIFDSVGTFVSIRPWQLRKLSEDEQDDVRASYRYELKSSIEELQEKISIKETV